MGCFYTLILSIKCNISLLHDPNRSRLYYIQNLELRVPFSFVCWYLNIVYIIYWKFTFLQLQQFNLVVFLTFSEHVFLITHMDAIFRFCKVRTLYWLLALSEAFCYLLVERGCSQLHELCEDEEIVVSGEILMQYYMNYMSMYSLISFISLVKRYIEK